MEEEILKQEEREEGIRNQIKYGDYSYDGSYDPKNVIKPDGNPESAYSKYLTDPTLI